MNEEYGCGATGRKACAHCGFNAREAKRRKRLPLELGSDGLWRKVIRREKKEDKP